MNLLRTQTPYRFIPPKNPLWFRPFLFAITWLVLRLQQKVYKTRIVGHERISKLIEEGHSVLVTPNHSDHADPGLMINVGRKGRFSFHFMAAREGFEYSWISRFVMQNGGAFSVNREGADVAATKRAIKTLSERKHPLVIFPEGEIYHHMEIVDEINEGVANIAIRAASKLPAGKRGYIVPCGIKLFNDPSSEKEICARLSALEKRITWNPRVGQDPIDRIYRIGSALLSIKEEEYLGAAQSGRLSTRLRDMRIALVGKVEEAHGVSNDNLSMPKRIRAIRGLIRKELTDVESPPEPDREEELYEQLDRIFLAHQMYSYPGAYLRARPSLDRIAETIYKLEEDFLGKARYLGKRTAEVVFGEPIDIKAFLEKNHFNAKTGVMPLTELIRDSIQNLLDE